ncbi:MAG: hypothetical protein AB7G13_18165 [Lautropia sp.]
MSEQLTFGYRGHVIAFDPEPLPSGGFAARAVVLTPIGPAGGFRRQAVVFDSPRFVSAQEAAQYGITQGVRWIDRAESPTDGD